MPLPTYRCTLEDSVCCTSVFDVAAHILAGATDALLACMDEDCRSRLAQYVTLGNGDDAVMDGISVIVRGITPSARTGQRQSMGVGLYTVAYEVRLLESGWPMAQVSGTQIIPPQPEEQMAIARYVYAHGEALYRKLINMTATGTMAAGGSKCMNVSLSALQSIPPAGGTVGWSVTVNADMVWA